MNIKSFLKLSVLVLTVVAVATVLQSCSNPLNPTAKFVGKWRVVSYVNGNGNEVKNGRDISYEFLSDEKTVIVIGDIGGGKTISAPCPFTVSKGDLLNIGDGCSIFRYEFKGNQLVLKYVGGINGAVNLVLVKE